ncbi:MAG: ABC transporter permease [Lachnospiraceae bacterium]|nr:ABC transporter permease [Lachnospiraceae bacterium]
MKRLYKSIKWGLFLNKRLLKKGSFLLVLLMVPLLIAGMRMAAKEESNVLTIALYGGPEDELAGEIIVNLLSEDSIVKYVKADSQEMARKTVENGTADAAWIFVDDLQGALQEVAVSHNSNVVTMVQREDNMQLRLARVKLYSAIYSKYLYAIFENFMETKLNVTDLSKEEMMKYFSGVHVRNDLFQMSYMNKDEEVAESNYLLTPLRGMLSVWLMLAGMASVMYFLQDKQNGLFDRVPIERRGALAVSYQWIVVLDGALMMLLSMLFTGTFVSWKKEIMCLLPFIFAAVGFCNLLRVLCGKMERLGALIPILILGMLVLCPVFIDFKSMRILQILFPPFYYLKSISSNVFLYEMLVYGAVVWIAGILIEWLCNKRKRV